MSDGKSINSYVNLPSRVIVHSPFLEKPLLSYGIVAYCRDTTRWLLVKRRNSPEFIITIRGSYRISEISRLVFGYSTDEIIRLKKVLTSFSSDCADSQRKIFRDLFESTIQYGHQHDIDYAELRLREARDIFENALKHFSGLTDTEWLWPKGRLLPNAETPYECALREFNEETGISLQKLKGAPPSGLSTGVSRDPYLLSPRPLKESFRGANGRLYETRCWIVIFPYEKHPPLLQTSVGEIGDRRWVTQKEAASLLNSPKYHILKEAQRMINYLDNPITEYQNDSWRTVTRKHR